MASYLAVTTGLIAIYTALRMTWAKDVPSEVFGAALFVLGAGAVALSAFTHDLLKNDGASKAAVNKSLPESILEVLKAEFARGNYSEVIRVGEAMSRPLFEAGAFKTRHAVGRMVEDAAARSSHKSDQISALIDSIGWSLVELGRYGEAEKQIRHGLRLLVDCPDPFYEAKAYRHLGVIARRQRRFDDARQFYDKARSVADGMPDDRSRLELVAGLEYALASLAYFEERYEDAARQIREATTHFSLLNDEYRLNMARVLQGDIEAKQGNGDDAKDTYRLVLESADRNKETLHYVRACLGLAEVRATEHEWEGVEQALDVLDELDLDEYKAERERLLAIEQKVPRSRSGR